MSRAKALGTFLAILMGGAIAGHFFANTSTDAQTQSVIQSGTVTPGHLAGWVTTGVIGDGGSVLIASPVANNAVCSSVTGSFIDCGVALASGATSGAVMIGQGVAPAAFKVASGDCLVSAAGAITCSSSNGVAFGAAPTAGQFMIAQSALAYAPKTMSGDCTIGTNGGVTCASANGVSWGVAPSAGQFLIAQSPTAYAPESISGDCTTSLTGVITCTKTNGVAFPTFGTAASTNYSQGTWTPALQGSSTTGSPTYTTQVGSYEIIGRMVHAQFLIVTTALGSPTGSMQIAGLPVAATSSASDNGTCQITHMIGVTLDASFTQLTGVIAPSAQVVSLWEIGSAQTGAATAVGKFAAGTTVQGQCIYHT